MKKLKRISLELRQHIPFTLIATLIAVILVFFIQKIDISKLFFVIHPLHIFTSAIVSSAIFYKYKKNFFQALVVGVVSSIFIGTLSDIIFPYLGGIIFRLKTEFHLSLIEEPLIIFSISIFGGIVGIATKWTKFPHFSHVFLSVFASLFYLVAFSAITSVYHFILAFVIVFVAVLIPCCISDIILPLLFLKRIMR
ncbi:hypothetical protein ACFLZF_00070 [Nanoarchaeota archaeon]